MTTTICKENKGKATPFSILIATHNASKIREFRAMAVGYPVVFRSLTEAGLSIDIEEEGTTFDENALYKARAVHALTRSIVLADDSGLVIDALDGAPGVYSARFAGVFATDGDRIAKVLHELRHVSRRDAAFLCSIAVIFPSGEERLYHGRLNGTIAEKPSGTEGFGFDPIFIPKGQARTLAEFSASEKNDVSHRGRALNAFFNDIGIIREKGTPHGEA